MIQGNLFHDRPARSPTTAAPPATCPPRQTYAAVAPLAGADVRDAPELAWCPWCRQSLYWQSRNGILVCATCHPPAAAGLVVEYVRGRDFDPDQAALVGCPAIALPKSRVMRNGSE